MILLCTGGTEERAGVHAAAHSRAAQRAAAAEEGAGPGDRPATEGPLAASEER